jgi:hypothetical protein
MPYYPLRDARRFVRSFTLDCHRKYKLDCIAEIFEGSKRKSTAYPRTCTDGRNKANSIQSVVDCALPRLFKLHRVLHQRTEQRKRQEAVRDRRAVRGFFFGAFTIEVNPLPVAGDFCKRGDAFLGYAEPIAYCDFTADKIFQRFDGGDSNGGHLNLRERSIVSRLSPFA